MTADPTLEESGGQADYADAFELQLSEPDAHPPETWMRAGLEGSPRALRALIVLIHRRVLRFELGPLRDPGHVLGWHLVESSSERARLEVQGPLMSGVLIAARTSESSVRLTTRVVYRTAAAAVVWRAIGPLHRLIAPLLVKRAARSL